MFFRLFFRDDANVVIHPTLV